MPSFHWTCAYQFKIIKFQMSHLVSLMEMSEMLFGCYIWNRNDDVFLLIIGRFMFTYEPLKNSLQEYAILVDILG